MFEKFNGTPLYLVNMLTVQRTEYQVDGPLTELAREVLGFGDTADLGKRAKEAEQASHYASVRFQPDYARAQDVRDGYRSEEHTSELQSLMRISYAVFCLKKKKKNTTSTIIMTYSTIAATIRN